MNTNLKRIAVVVVIIGVAFWAVTSVLPQSHSGKQLTFGVGGGTVQLENPTTEPVAVQIVGTGSRTFTVSGSIEGIGGTSTRQGSGSTSTQLFEYALPPGPSEFKVTRGTNVSFVSPSDTSLKATVMPLAEGDARTTLIVAGLVILGGLYYLSGSIEHSWLKWLMRGGKPAPVIPAPVVEAPAAGDPNRGRDGRMYSSYGSKD